MGENSPELKKKIGSFSEGSRAWLGIKAVFAPKSLVK